VTSSANYNQNGFRFRDDSTAAQGGTPAWLAAENTNVSIVSTTAQSKLIRLRVRVQNTTATAGTSDVWRIFASKNGGTYTQVTTSTGATLGIQSADASSSADELSLTSALLTGGTGTFVSGRYDETGATTATLVGASSHVEHEFGLQIHSSVTGGDTIDLRVYRVTNTALNTYGVTPRITITTPRTAKRFRLDVSDLTKIWQNSTKTTSAAVDSPVGYIEDAYGTGLDVQQSASGSRPTLRYDSTLSRYYLEFDGLDDYLVSVNTTSLNLDEFVLFIASQRTGSAAWKRAFAISGSTNSDTTTDALSTQIDTASGTFYIFTADGGAPKTGSGTSFEVDEGYKIGSSTTALIDGAAGTATTLASLDNSRTTNFYIGATNAGSMAGFYEGRIYSLEFDGTTGLSSGDRSTLRTAHSSGNFAGGISGTLAATGPSDTAAISGAVLSAGSLTATEASDAASFAAALVSSGTLTATGAADVAAIAASLVWQAALAGTEAPDTAALAGVLTSSGSLTATEASDAAAVIASLMSAGTLGATEAPDTAAISGTVGAGADSWNTADASTRLAFSGANLVATRSSTDTGQHALVRSNRSRDTGDYLFTVLIDLTGGDIGVGLAKSGAALDYPGSYPGASNDANGFFWFNNSWREGGGITGAAATGSVGFTTGDLIGIRKAGSSVTLYKWSGSSWTTVETVTNLGSGNWFPAFAGKITGDAGTANFGGSAMTLPASVSSWDGSQTGVATISGTLAATEAADVATITGALVSSGTLTATEAADVAAVVAELRSSGALTGNEASDTAMISGAIASIGTLGATEAADVAAFVAQLISTGTLAATGASDTAAISGTVSSNITGTLAATEAADTAAFIGASLSSGTLTATEASDVAALTAALVSSGTLTGQGAADTATITGSLIAQGILTGSELPDSAAIAAALISTGTLSGQEAGDTGSFLAALLSSGTLAGVEASDAVAIGMLVGNVIGGSLAAGEAPDAATIAGAVASSGVLTGTEQGDTAAIIAGLPPTGTLAAQEAPDAASILGTVRDVISGVLTGLEAADVAAVVGAVAGSITGILAATEAPGTAAVVGRILGVEGVSPRPHRFGGVHAVGHIAAVSSSRRVAGVSGMPRRIPA